MISTCEPYRQSEQKRCEKFCGSKEQKAPGLAKKGETGCSLGAGGGGSGWKRMRADGKTRSLKQNAPNNHAIQEKRKPEKTQCFRRFCGRGRRSWLVCRLGCCSPVGSSTDRGGSQGRRRSLCATGTHCPSARGFGVDVGTLYRERGRAGVVQFLPQVPGRAVLFWCCERLWQQFLEFFYTFSFL